MPLFLSDFPVTEKLKEEKNLKRKLLLALIALTCALCLVFSLAGCKPAENQSGAQQETPGGQGSGSSDSEDNPGGQGGEQGGNSDEHVHNYGELIPEQPATCKKEGLQAHYYCEGCEKYFDSEKHETTLEKLKIDIDLNAHSYGELIPEQPATCTAEGMQAHYYCEVCKKYFDSEKHETTLEQLKISANTHNYIYKCGQTEHWQVCADCGEETAHTPHSVSEGVCPACGFVEKCTEGLEFTEIEENDEIIGYSVSNGTATDSHIFIPSFYNNLPVISIGDWAFYNCTSLTEITIPANVTSIGGWAFQYCSSLTEITIPESVTSIGGGVFQFCSSLTEITIPESVTSIDGAFQGCTSLTEITIPNRITSIGDYTFLNCTSLTEINIPDSVTYIGEDAFSRCAFTEITIGNGVTSIGGGAFCNCESLTEITISASVTSIGEYAFRGCTSLESITVDKKNKVYRSESNCIIETETQTLIVGCKSSKIPESVTSIGDYAFEDCIILTEIAIPASVTSIGSGAFARCESLESITVDKKNKVYRSESNCIIETETQTLIVGCKSSKIPEGVTTIGESAFAGCTSLNEITIPNSVTSIGERAFQGCTSLKRVYFCDNSNLTSIGDFAFYGCKNLIEITIPNRVTSIGRYSFAGCTSLTEITIPDSVTSIGFEAFYGCTSLTEITIPDSVTSIDRNAFRECTSLERVIFENTAGWKVSESYDMANFEEINVSDPEQNAENLKYADYYWKRGE